MSITVNASIYSDVKYQILSSAASWAGARDATTGTTNGNANVNIYVDLYSGDGLYYVYRTFLVFDTSTLTGNVTACTFTIKNSATLSTNGNSNFYASTQASTTAITGTDFDNCGTTAYSDSNFSHNQTSGSTQTLTLNAAGLSALNTARTGAVPFKICIRNVEKDVANSAPASDYGASLQLYNPSQAGGNVPYITATVESGGATIIPVPQLLTLGVG